MANEAENEVVEAMCPADDNNMHPGKLHSRYFVEQLNVAREIRLELEKKLGSGCNQVAAAGKFECICECAFRLKILVFYSQM